MAAEILAYFSGRGEVNLLDGFFHRYARGPWPDLMGGWEELRETFAAVGVWLRASALAPGAVISTGKLYSDLGASEARVRTLCLSGSECARGSSARRGTAAWP